MWEYLVLFLIAVLTVVYLYFTRNFGKFKEHGIYEHDPAFPLGCSEMNKAMMGMDGGFIEFSKKVYDKHRDKKLIGFHGFFGKSILIVDLDTIKQMLIKDFDYFIDKPIFDLSNKYLNAILTQIEGETWRRARHASTPVFTSGKMKKMSKVMKKVADDLLAQLDKFAATGEEVDAKDLSFKYTVTIIANAGFGIDANALDGSPQGVQFLKMARKISGSDQTLWDIAKQFITIMLPKFLMKLGPELINVGAVSFFNDIIDQTLKMRETQGTKSSSMVDLFSETMMGEAADEEDIKKEVEKELEGQTLAAPKKFTMEEMDTIMRGNLFALFLAGMELPAIMMSGCIYFLAKNQDVQEKLSDEMKEANLDDNLDYNTVMNLPYLDMVVQEALRHSAFADGNWKCARDYQVPGTNTTIPKGMHVTLSARGISMDERFFPDPTAFNPENFTKKNKESRPALAGSEIGFSIGPRKCIGNRFAILQFKTGIANMVNKFRILPTPRTPEKYESDPNSGTFVVKGGNWVKFERRD